MAWDRPYVLSALSRILVVPSSFWGVAAHLATIVGLLLPFLAVGSPTVLALRLQQPRPRLRALMEQPGAVACAVASVAVVPVVLTVLFVHFTAGRPMAVAWTRAVDDLKPERLAVIATLIGLAVLIAWIVLRAKQQWHPEASWVDRLGRLIGCGWIAMIFGGAFHLFLELANVARMSG
jgi:hypothetical protein